MARVLILKMSALGDVVVAAAHVERILEHHRTDEVWLLTGPEAACLFTHHPQLRTAVLDRGRGRPWQGTWARVLWVRQKRFAVVYDLQGNRTSRRLVRWSGAGRRVGTQPLSVYDLHPTLPYDRDTAQNVFDRLNETLVSGGVPPAPAAVSFHVCGVDRAKVEGWRVDRGLLAGGFACLHAGSSPGWPSKRWPRESFRHLALMLEQRGLPCVWVGGRADREVNGWLARRVGVDATGLFSPVQLYELARTARLAVANDSGPMHLFAAACIPVFGLFGPTSWIRSHGLGQKDRVVHGSAPCSPCFKGRCPDGKGHVCLGGIPPEAVMEKIWQQGVVE